jgi:hypothetical protein
MVIEQTMSLKSASEPERITEFKKDESYLSHDLNESEAGTIEDFIAQVTILSLLKSVLNLKIKFK